jgi:hypothetical protein
MICKIEILNTLFWNFIIKLSNIYFVTTECPVVWRAKQLDKSNIWDHNFSSLSVPQAGDAWSRASSFRWNYPLLCLRSSSSFLRLFPRLPVTSIPQFLIPSITCCRQQFLHQMWPIGLAFRLLISCRIFPCSCFSHDRSNWSFQSFSSHTFQNFPSVSDVWTYTYSYVINNAKRIGRQIL